jgi:GDP-L-fucose synthase
LLSTLVALPKENGLLPLENAVARLRTLFSGQSWGVTLRDRTLLVRYLGDSAEACRQRLEPTNEPYAIAKITGIKLYESYNRQYGRDYRSVMPTNLCGFSDNFHPEDSRVVPSLIRRFHDAKFVDAAVVKAWGTGKPRREFLFVDEMAEASIFVMNLGREKYHRETLPMLSHINVGTRVGCTIKQLAETVARVICYQGEIEWDCTKSDGASRKRMDVSCLERLGWKASICLEEGLASTYKWFLAQQGGYRK